VPRVDKSIFVNAPIDRVYEIWSDFEGFPRFMEHIEEIRSTGGNRYHWKAKIGGTTQEWDAEVTDMARIDHITWRAVSGTTNDGTVSFASQGEATMVSLSISYEPPGPMLKLADTILQQTERDIDDDLKNFKRLAEQGSMGAGMEERAHPGANP
jgi:uncharacterized membrane protein